MGIEIPRAIGSTFLTLIPKKDSLRMFADFRPISLSNFMSKVSTRILTSRMTRLLDAIISIEQEGFMEGRDISEQILLAQELTQLLNKKVRGGNIMVKLDMMKAFYRVS